MTRVLKIRQAPPLLIKIILKLDIIIPQSVTVETAHEKQKTPTNFLSQLNEVH
jgi:hypothetical protein